MKTVLTLKIAREPHVHMVNIHKINIIDFEMVGFGAPT